MNKTLNTQNIAFLFYHSFFQSFKISRNNKNYSFMIYVPEVKSDSSIL